jgi:hypothetical protein
VNLRQALKERRSPALLVQMPTVTVVVQHDTHIDHRLRRSYRQIFTGRLPFFRWC